MSRRLGMGSLFISYGEATTRVLQAYLVFGCSFWPLTGRQRLLPVDDDGLSHNVNKSIPD